MAEPRYWCLRSTTRPLVLKALSLEELRLAVSLIAAKDKLNWLIWRPGWAEWKPLATAPEVLIPFARENALTPPPIEEDQVEKAIREAFSEPVTLSRVSKPSESATDSERVNENSFVVRQFKRYVRQFPIEITEGTKSFKTHTLNISAGGALLADPLPSWVVGYFSIKILRPNDSAMKQLTCAVVENQNPRHRHRVEFHYDENHAEALTIAFDRWLGAA